MNILDRKVLGSKASIKLRKNNFIPGILWLNKIKKINIILNLSIIKKISYKEKIIAKYNNNIILINLKSYQFNPINNKIIHIEYIQVDKILIKNKIPILFLNFYKCSAIKFGGLLKIFCNKVSIICNFNIIPNYIKINLEKYSLNEKITLNHIKSLDKSLICINNNNLILGIIS